MIFSSPTRGTWPPPPILLTSFKNWNSLCSVRYYISFPWGGGGRILRLSAPVCLCPLFKFRTPKLQATFCEFSWKSVYMNLSFTRFHFRWYCLQHVQLRGRQLRNWNYQFYFFWVRESLVSRRCTFIILSIYTRVKCFRVLNNILRLLKSGDIWHGYSDYELFAVLQVFISISSTQWATNKPPFSTFTGSLHPFMWH
jgi:hypothetical protein